MCIRAHPFGCERMYILDYSREKTSTVYTNYIKNAAFRAAIFYGGAEVEIERTAPVRTLV